MPGWTDFVSTLGTGLQALPTLPATVFRAYAETQVGANPPRRFLLNLDPSQVAGGAQVVNYLDLDAAATQPDVTVQVTPHANGQGVDFVIAPIAGRAPTSASVYVYLSLESDVFPVAGAAPEAAAVLVFGLRGAAGRVVPSLRASLAKSGPAGLDRLRLELGTSEAAEPLELELGTFEGPLSSQPAVLSSYVALTGTYLEVPQQIRIGDRTSAPTSVLALVTVRDRTAAPLTLMPPLTVTLDTRRNGLPSDGLVARYTAPSALDLDAVVATREPNQPSERVETYAEALPTDLTVTYEPAPAATVPKVRYQADAVLGGLRVVLPTFASGTYRFAEARVRTLAREVGAHWEFPAPDRALIEIGGLTRRRPTSLIGQLAAVLAQGPRPWREAPQTVALELVEKWRSATSLEKARLSASVRGLRLVRVAVGEAGPRHARDGEGLTTALELAQDPLRDDAGDMRLVDRSLRLLRSLDRYVGTKREHSRLSVRAGALPDALTLDLRANAAEPYFGVHATGVIRRLKVLALNDPSGPAEASGQSTWVTVPETAAEVDFVSTALDRILSAAAPSFAELTLRDPNRLGGGPEAPTIVKGALAFPRTLRLLPARIRQGACAAGSNATTLVDPGAGFDATLVGKSLRYLSGPLDEQRRAITAVAGDGNSLTTAPFGASPTVGDSYAIESSEGLVIETDALGGRVGLSGRVAISKDETLLASRAGPQLKARTAPPISPSRSRLAALTARVYGLTGFELAAPGTTTDARVLLDPNRVNKSFRVQLRDLDTTFAPAERELLKFRVAELPPELAALLTLAGTDLVVDLMMSAASGAGAFWMEPGLLRTDGGAAGGSGTVAGIGLLQFAFDGVPRGLRFTALPFSGLPSESAPRNFTPPASWRLGGLKLESADTLTLRFLRAIGWDRDHPSDATRVFWSRSSATFLTLTQPAPAPTTGVPRLDPFWVWSPVDRSSTNPAMDPENPDGGLGFRIDPGLRVTLDLDSYERVVSAPVSRWNGIGTPWRLKAELQMQNYANEVTVAGPLGPFPAGDEGAGPGLWFLRVVDARGWFPIGFGSAYFGNTSGTIASRSRIFA